MNNMDWYILNLPRRKDRRVLSVANAVRLSVPPANIHFWEAKDADDYEDADDILQAIIDDGFPEFAGHPPNYVNLGKNCHIWNVCRFLRDLINSDDPARMFCHDGIIFATAGMTFIADYFWFMAVVNHLHLFCKDRNETFNFLQIGHMDFFQGHYHKPIRAGSIILEGVASYDNFARIYSREGAEMVLERILTTPGNFREIGPNGVLQEDFKEPLSETKYWQPPGAFSTALTFVRDMPNTWLGSDTVDIPIHRQKFAELLQRDVNLQKLQ